MQRNILIPTDFSEHAWNALNYAIHLYKEEACTFYLLNAYQVFDFPSDALLPRNPAEKRFQRAALHSESNLKKLQSQLEFRSNNAQHRFVPISSYALLLQAIKEAVKEHEIDMIIMGTRGESNHSIREFGSNAVAVMDNIKQCPIMAIPPKATMFVKGSKKEIVFSTNFKTPYRREDLGFLLDTAKLFKAHIRVLHVHENGKLTPLQLQHRQQIEEFLQDTRHSFHTLTNVRVALGIQLFLESRGSDMLAMIHKKHSFFNSIFTVPMVEQLNEKQRVPLLVMHE